MRADGRRPRRRHTLAVIFGVLLVVPTVEIAVIVAVGRVIGGWPTLALLLLESGLGAWLVRREGSKAWTALSTAVASGRMPAEELVDGALVLAGGTLLLTPGFVTDLVGFGCVLPLTRSLARRLLGALLARRLAFAQQTMNGPLVPGPVISGSVVDGPVVDGPVDDPPRSGPA
jgi:UPF0716 protein FxsA